VYVPSAPQVENVADMIVPQPSISVPQPPIVVPQAPDVIGVPTVTLLDAPTWSNAAPNTNDGGVATYQQPSFDVPSGVVGPSSTTTVPVRGPRSAGRFSWGGPQETQQPGASAFIPLQPTSSVSSVHVPGHTFSLYKSAAWEDVGDLPADAPTTVSFSMPDEFTYGTPDERPVPEDVVTYALSRTGSVSFGNGGSTSVAVADAQIALADDWEAVDAEYTPVPPVVIPGKVLVRDLAPETVPVPPVVVDIADTVVHHAPRLEPQPPILVDRPPLPLPQDPLSVPQAPLEIPVPPSVFQKEAPVIFVPRPTVAKTGKGKTQKGQQ